MSRPAKGPATWLPALAGLMVVIVVLMVLNPPTDQTNGNHPTPSDGSTAPESQQQPTDPPPSVPAKEPQALRDHAGDLADQLWQDLVRTTQVSGVYSEILWKTATDSERLLVVCKYGEQALADRLLKLGADPNYADRSTGERGFVCWSGATPLMMASQRGDQGTVQLLLEHGAQVNAADAADETALYHAVRAGHEEVTLLLLEHGADPNARSARKNDTPYGLAFGQQMQRAMAAMKERGGNF